MPAPGSALDDLADIPPTGRVLDLSRLVSRAGRVLTGVDRVELAYLNRLLSLDTPCFGLVKTTLGFILLDRSGMTGLRDRIEGRVPFGKRDLLSHVSRKASYTQKAAIADLRRLCIDRCRPKLLSKMLEKHVPQGAAYLNVGHSNFSKTVLSACKQDPITRVSVFVHDTIPLDFPDFQRPETVDRFRAFLKRVSRHADLVLCNSRVTKDDIGKHMAGWGGVPPAIVSHLGTIPMPTNPLEPDLEAGIQSPYFMVIGTIEPRKNHAFLLDLWEKMEEERPATEVPQLVICGSRGWNNDTVFRRLDQLSATTHKVRELGNLSDAEMGYLLKGASGVLFPSFAEGFGLPAVEAAMAGTPVICNDLPVFREILGDIPIYANVSDSYLWQSIILSIARGEEPGSKSSWMKNGPARPPTWDEHFNVILKVT